jgi:hypothetical protein
MTTETVKRCPKCSGQVQVKTSGLSLDVPRCWKCFKVFGESEFNALPEWGERRLDMTVPYTLHATGCPCALCRTTPQP